MVACMRIAKLTDMSLEELRSEFQALKIPSEAEGRGFPGEGGGGSGGKLICICVSYLFTYSKAKRLNSLK